MKNMHEKDKNRTVPDIFKNQEVSDHPKVNKLTAFLYCCLFIALIFVYGCNQQPSEDYKRNHPSAFQVNAFVRDISPDNKMLLFSYGTPYYLKLATYNMKTGVVRVFSDVKTKMNVAPSFSLDGRRIVFLGAKEQGLVENIYVMNLDGGGVRQITKYMEYENEDIFYVRTPSFLPDGKRIIFSRSYRKRERAFPLRGEMHSDWDIYAVDVESGDERRLTNYNFYNVSSAYYMADGKRFIFSGEGPYNTTGKGPKDFREYEEKYHKNFVFIMDGGKNDLKPTFVNGTHSFRPSVSNDDTIIFISRTNEMDGLATAQDTQDLFLYKEGKIERLTKLHAYITWARISRDGCYIIFNKKADKKSRDDSDWLMKSDGTGLKEIKIPLDNLKN